MSMLTYRKVLLYNGLGLTGSLPLLLYAVYVSWAAFLNWVGSLIVDRAGRIRMLTIGIVSHSIPFFSHLLMYW